MKRTVGDRVDVTARIFRDGHELLGAAVRYKPAGATRWQEAPLEPLGNDEWAGSFDVDRRRHLVLPRRGLGRPRRLVPGRAAAQGRRRPEGSRGRARRGRGAARRREADASRRRSRRPQATASGEDVVADATRSTSTASSRASAPGTSSSRARGAASTACATVLPRARRARLRRRLPAADPSDRRVEPQGPEQRARRRPEGSRQPVGDRLRRRAATTRSIRSSARSRSSSSSSPTAKKLGIEIALDFAIQCSPDHPWLKEHPEWFNRRPDGTLKYAENPPKRYQDIYNVNFDSEDWKGLWEALRDVVLYWVERGVTVFRVDNPHTKPVPFWEWLIDEVRARASRGDLPRGGVHAAGDDDDARQGRLRAELHVLHVEEHALGAARVRRRSCSSGRTTYRPNFFANTPDILHEYLAARRPPAFEARLVLAATLSPCYGIYSGLRELRERAGARGLARSTSTRRSTRSKKRALDGPLLPLVAALNAARRDESRRCSTSTTSRSSRPRTSSSSRYLKRTRRQRGHRRRQPRPVGGAGGRRASSRSSTGLPPDVPRARPARRRRDWTWHIGRNYVRARRPGTEPRLAGSACSR